MMTKALPPKEEELDSEDSERLNLPLYIGGLPLLPRERRRPWSY